MSSPRRAESTPTVARGAKNRVKQAVRVSCDAVPKAPENPFMIYDQLGRHRHHRFRGIWGCDEVTQDTDGHDVHPEGYIWRIREVNSSGADQWGGKWPSDSIRNKPGDPFIANERTMGHGFFHHGHYYQSSWAAYNQNGVSDWSDWSPKTQFLETVQPLAPTITLFDVDQHKARVEWTNPTDPGNVLIHHRDTVKNIIQIATGSGFSTIILKHEQYAGLDGHHLFKHIKPGNSTYWCRVGAVTQGGLIEWSTAVSGSRLLPPTPTAPAVAFDALGPKKANYRGKVTVSTVSSSEDDIHHYDVQLVHKATHATPTTGDKRDTKHIPGDASGDDLTAIFRPLPKNHYVYARARGVDKHGHEGAFSSWTDAGRPSGGAPNAPTSLTMTHPAPRRFVWTWDVPSGGDADVDKYKVEVYAGASLRQTVYHSAQTYHHAYHVPKADRGTSHSAKVYSVDEDGNTSGAATSSSTTLSEKVGGNLTDTDLEDAIVYGSRFEIGGANGAFSTAPAGTFPRVELQSGDAPRVKFMAALGVATSIVSGYGFIAIGGNTYANLAWGDTGVGSSFLYRDSTIWLNKMGANPVNPSDGVKLTCQLSDSSGSGALGADGQGTINRLIIQTPGGRYTPLLKKI